MATRDTYPRVPNIVARSVTAHGPRLLTLCLWLIAGLLLLGEVLSIRPAAAQARCGDRSVVIERLESQHLETPQAIGLSTDGRLFEVLVSSSGSWTIVVTDPNRKTCLVATGESWESILPITTGPQA